MREPACLQIPLLAVKTGQPRFDTTDWDVVVKKKPSKIWELLFVWRSGRDSNSRPHAWQACILTKLNYRTVHYCIWFFKGLSLSLKCGCKSTTFFLNPPNKNAHFLKLNLYNTILQRIKKQTFFTHQSKNSLKTVYFAAIFRKIEPFLCKETSKNTYN